MMNSNVSKILIPCTSLGFGLSLHAIPSEERPNILLILADDMGYSDLGCMGSEISTPNLDQLASEGVLFSNFYNTSRSCPTRAALLTGQYQWDAGIGHMNTTKTPLPEYQGYLNRECLTIAEALKLGGYRTFMSGKWHVGDNAEHWPDKRGFDEYYGFPAGGGIYYYPSKNYDRTLYHNGVEQFPDEDWYSTDGFTDATIDFIARSSESDVPFFIYQPYIAPHFPLQAKPEDIAKYEDLYLDGFETIREGRIARQRELGLIGVDEQVSGPIYTDWAKVKKKADKARQMAVYAAMVDCLDQNVGRLVAALKANGKYENTVIIFLSDNGAVKSDFNKTPSVKIGTRDSNSSYGQWYNVSNTPLKNGKATEYEGGNRTPLIIHWAKGITPHEGYYRELGHVMDLMPTCLELAEVEYPKQYEGVELSPLDGVSLVSAARTRSVLPERVLCWEHEGNCAIRRGDWKMVCLRKKSWELYDLQADPNEIHNVINSKSEIAAELKGLYETWAKKHGVHSWPLPKVVETDYMIMLCK